MSNLNPHIPQTLDLLLRRKSVKPQTMTGPGPDEAQMTQILTAATRVPDHGKLAPWRFIRFCGDARGRFGQVLVDTLQARGPLSPDRQSQEAARFLRAPEIVGVISHPRSDVPVPEWEQILSAGAVCQNLILAAHALGYVATWLTEWYAYDREILQKLGLDQSERIAGFIFIGRMSEMPQDRPRPDLATIVSHY
ncbi:MAG: nitroreductase [Rhizomicrobium sp.]